MSHFSAESLLMHSQYLPQFLALTFHSVCIPAGKKFLEDLTKPESTKDAARGNIYLYAVVSFIEPTCAHARGLFCITFCLSVCLFL